MFMNHLPNKILTGIISMYGINKLIALAITLGFETAGTLINSSFSMDIFFNFEKDISADATVGGVVNSISEAVTTVKKFPINYFKM